MKSGVYIIKNKITGECYVGSSNNVHQRWNGHKFDLRKNSNKHPALQIAWNVYGEHAFEFKLLAQVPKEQLREIEQLLLDKLHPAYNINRFSNTPDPLIVHSPKSLKKLSSSVKELWKNPEYHAKHCKPRNWKNGIPNRRGAKLSDEQKKHLSQINSGENNPNYGKPRCQSFMDKMCKIYSGAISPDGIIYSPIVGLNAFCREHGLDNAQMSRVLSGKSKSHKGWVRYNDT